MGQGGTGGSRSTGKSQDGQVELETGAPHLPPRTDGRHWTMSWLGFHLFTSAKAERKQKGRSFSSTKAQLSGPRREAAAPRLLPVLPETLSAGDAGCWGRLQALLCGQSSPGKQILTSFTQLNCEKQPPKKPDSTTRRIIVKHRFPEASVQQV